MSIPQIEPATVVHLMWTWDSHQPCPRALSKRGSPFPVKQPQSSGKVPAQSKCIWYYGMTYVNNIHFISKIHFGILILKHRHVLLKLILDQKHANFQANTQLYIYRQACVGQLKSSLNNNIRSSDDPSRGTQTHSSSHPSACLWKKGGKKENARRTASNFEKSSRDNQEKMEDEAPWPLYHRVSQWSQNYSKLALHQLWDRHKFCYIIYLVMVI